MKTIKHASTADEFHSGYFIYDPKTGLIISDMVFWEPDDSFILIWGDDDIVDDFVFCEDCGILLDQMREQFIDTPLHEPNMLKDSHFNQGELYSLAKIKSWIMVRTAFTATTESTRNRTVDWLDTISFGEL